MTPTLAEVALAGHFPHLFRCSCGERIKTRPLADPGENEAAWAAHVAPIVRAAIAQEDES